MALDFCLDVSEERTGYCMTVLPDTEAATRSPAAVARVIDYEHSPYRTEFWETVDRSYEDAVERLALRRLLPVQGQRLVDLGAGFGRLANEYAGYRQVVLFDYSRTMLEQAVARWGHDPRFVFVAGNVYQMPFRPASMNTVVMIRVMHHLEQSLQALRQIDTILCPNGVSLLEYANKRNLKAVVRHALGRQSWSPHAREPVEFVEMNFNFHPAWMQAQLAHTNLVCETRYGVSHFRVPWLKRLVPGAWLAALDSCGFRWGGHYPLAPSVFLRTIKSGPASTSAPVAAAADPLPTWLRCPHCPVRTLVQPAASLLHCPGCSRQYARRHGIWDFRDTAI